MYGGTIWYYVMYLFNYVICMYINYQRECSFIDLGYQTLLSLNASDLVQAG